MTLPYPKERNIPEYGFEVNKKRDRSFLNFLENSVVHERNSDSWEFGKGALSAN
jgi:hypothetical protein